MSIKRFRKFLDPKSKDNQEIISDKLNKLASYLNDSYNINSGGCCFVSYIIANLLREDNFKYSIIVWSRYKLPKHFESLTEGNFHYAIKLGENIINGEDCHHDDDLYEREYTDINARDILNHYKYVLDMRDWNECYDTHLNPFIRKIIKTTYAKITEELRE